MSDEDTEEKPFYVDRARSGRAGCKKCKLKIDSGSLRLAKVANNPFGSGKVKMWHHVNCMFEVFKKQRPTTARINSPEDIGNWDNTNAEDQEEILSYLPKQTSPAKTPAKQPTKSPAKSPAKRETNRERTPAKDVDEKKEASDKNHKDNSFREFRRLCADIANEPSYTGKTAIVKKMFTEGSDKTGFKGDLLLWCRLLLPGAVKRVYNLQSKQLVKLFARIFQTDHDAMIVDLEQGDVAETVRIFFEKSRRVLPSRKSTLTLPEVDLFLSRLAEMTKEEEQTAHFESVAKVCSSNDLKMIVRLVKHDLRINAGPKHVLEAVHPDAYRAFQASRDIGAILSRAGGDNMAATVTLMTPVQPMLAEPCRAVEYAMRKCPHGMYSEIKYDGERVQVHKQGGEFKYYSRSLKPVMPHKVAHLKEYIPRAFPHGEDLILDAEILLIDTTTGLPLPFGSLGVHKRTAFKRANVCLFVFDCMYYNGELLMDRPVLERRRILEKKMKQIDNRVMFSEVKILNTAKELEGMITDVFRRGLEGLVLKDVKGAYEPGKRHWLKVKKDYLFGGSMADSVDLVVLGAWYGTGAKGGMMSSFLMGVRDSDAGDNWLTVTKVHGGHDDATLQALQTELDMVKVAGGEAPTWLKATKTMVPDLVARDPLSMPVWEVSGAEFTQHEVHTAKGISVRFPRVTKVRGDKDWRTATTLDELVTIYEKSKEAADFTLPESCVGGEDASPSPSEPPPAPKRDGAKELERGQQKLNFESPAKKKKQENRGGSLMAEKRGDEKVRGQQKLSFESPAKKKKQENGGESSTVEKRGDEKAGGQQKLSFERPVKKKKHENGRESEDRVPAKRSKAVDAPSNPLPDWFRDVRLRLPDDTKDRESLERYLVAYGGCSLSPADVGRSTHVLYVDGVSEKHTWPKGAQHVDIAWLWDSIKLGSLQDAELYRVGGELG